MEQTSHLEENKPKQEVVQDIKDSQEPFTKQEELINALGNMAMDDVCSLKVAEMKRKLHITGLHRATTSHTLTQVYGLYGEIEECKVIMDQQLKRCKGSASITYKEECSALKALKHPYKIVDRRTTHCRLASTVPQMEEVCDSGYDKPFHCQICNELVYKPVVEACGHVFCFWCIHLTMRGVRTSHCPLCRSPYKHFPRVCELLHYILLKAFPEEYRQRTEEVFEWEKQKGTFSPQLSDPQTDKNVDTSKLENSASAESFPRGESRQNDFLTKCTVMGPCANIISSDDEINTGMNSNHTSSLFNQSASYSVETLVNMHNVEATAIQDCVASETLNDPDNAKSCISQNKLTVNDALCCDCRELIYLPTVLNCGHAFCETCVSISEDGTLKCQVCRSVHPGYRPRICLELNHFLERMFPLEYAERKKSILVNKKTCKQSKEESTSCIKKAENTSAEVPANPSEQAAIIHPGVGCDYCGIIPIMGKRYKCLDCSESIGFDLCEKCYETGSSLPGRFNQKHTAEHSFEVIHGNLYEQSILQVIPEQFTPWMHQLISQEQEHIEISDSSENSEISQDDSQDNDPNYTLGLH